MSKLRVVFFVLGDKAESELYVPTFRNTLFHLHRLCHGTGRVFRNVGTKSGAGEIPQKKDYNIYNSAKVRNHETV